MALEKDGVAFNYIADGNKNITQLIDMSSGSVANLYDYSPFGQLSKNTETVANVFKFSSEYAEKETGLIYYNYRYYNPTVGKWTKRDPIEEQGGLNVYAFVDNDSVIYTDSLGLHFTSDPTMNQHSHDTPRKSEKNYNGWSNDKNSDDRKYNNCYGYAINRKAPKGSYGSRPGQKGGTATEPIDDNTDNLENPQNYCAELRRRAKSDGLKMSSMHKKCPACYHKVVAFASERYGRNKAYRDYHWYRKDDDGTWSSKEGHGGKISNKDKDGKIITDPVTANRGDYTYFCAYMCAPDKWEN
ncbi:RHS repeat-associated core domain-containing protein [Lentisphaerota bacterium WC36G]